MAYVLHFYLYKNKDNHTKQGQTVAIPESTAAECPNLAETMFQLEVRDTGANSVSVALIWFWTNFFLSLSILL